MNAPIIFVWIGAKLPSFAYDSLRFCNDANPSREIFLFTNVSKCDPAEDFAKVVHIGDDKTHKHASTISKMEFEGNFWIYTSLRFYILEDLCRSLKIHKFYHAELDNAVFNLDGLDEIFDRYGEGLFVPRDSTDRAIASLIYCNRTASLTELTELYIRQRPPKHDMDALGIYATEYPDYFFSLPTESFEENRKSWKINDPAVLGGLFDAAAIGQYLLGVDPIHCRFKPCRNGFVNENCLVNLKKVEFIVRDKKIFIRFPSSKTEFQFFNIHLHSKNFSAFNGLIKNGEILKRLNRGNKSIISNHVMILIGPIIFVIHKVIVLIKKVLGKMRKGIFSHD